MAVLTWVKAGWNNLVDIAPILAHAFCQIVEKVGSTVKF